LWLVTVVGMSESVLDPEIDQLWGRRAGLSPSDIDARELVVAALARLDAGEARCAVIDPGSGGVIVDERAKRAILLSFAVLPMLESRLAGFRYHDRMPLKTQLPGVRVVPGAIVRWGSHVQPGVVLMPSFVNVGAYVATNTMVDTWATVGSGAQVGRNVHLSGGAGLGGVLEPPQAAPVVVEDDAFIGSRCMIVEGARVRRGAKLGAGTMLTASTRVYDAQTGDELARGEIPERAVAVGSTRTRRFPGGEFGMPCVLVLRRLGEDEVHDKLALNDVLREHGIAP
jgi:2,3,4,5-tetrahydropyridine-2-carboxylate N-succinyltransferase